MDEARVDMLPDKQNAPLVTVASASGGVGKSAIAFMASCLAAKSGLSVALVEADLQFGDFGFWLDLDSAQPTLAQGTRTAPLHIKQNLDLFKAPCFPELAEDIADEVAELALHMRSSYDLVVVDTGGFWSGLNAELIVNADACLLVADRRPSTLAGTVRVIELCQRMGVAGPRRICVYNRFGPKARVSADEAKRILGVPEILCIPDGKQIVDKLLCAGDADELIEMENPFARGIDELLACVLPKIGSVYQKRFEERKRRWRR